jgi:hypothetical protein
MMEFIEFLKPVFFGAPMVTVIYGILQIWEKAPDEPA